ncbi:lysine--tRNA ligase [Aquirufa nivalisilvae]|jgi:lysyl-tRNA synthetase class 2|uniref:Lysine--tRNA ligase n=1 Tax=Aquirufa nivalisilvae TaxID=2516557 RepID=A0A2S2DTV4_9BACT|nr:lysine--tRNA ligase [Aquirufa nivalisilvae]AWL08739.1 Lysine--tRNA ligase [Aquirufa nivalisilvae]MCZ2483109.1 lysine--tRNA ligase [Aquirufa nivalisilvae]
MILSEQEQLRRQKRLDLMALGIDPYPAEAYPVNVYAKEILSDYSPESANFQDVTLAGRLMGFRIMGNASFAELQDASGRIQLYFRRDDLCPGEDKTLYNTVFKKLLDIGDIIGVKGYVFTTQMGEISVHVREFTLLSKALKPLPVVKEAEGQTFDAFSDPEMRYRQRYVDLIVNPSVKDIFIKRAKIISTMRAMFDERGWLEVETPVLQAVHGGASARPFKTHHNTLDMPLYLRIANELYLKRLIVGGFDGVYEFGKMFRNEGMDRTHNPEFTSLEFYVAYKDYHWMMDLTEKIFETVAQTLHQQTKVMVGDNAIEFAGPYPKLSISEAILKYSGVDVDALSEDALRAKCLEFGMEVDEQMGKGKLIDELFGEKVEANLIQPTFIIDYPVEMSPLTKKHRSKEGLVERFELFVNGKEIANAYSELNDPIDQKERFEDQLRLAEKGDDEAMVMDHDFIRSLEYAMPPTSGIGIGIDRLTMLMTNQASIQEVLFFPQMRPEVIKEVSSDADFVQAGVAEYWIPALQKMGILTLEALKAANPNKVFNDLGGLRKKLKIEAAMPSKEEVVAWIES